MIYFGPYRPSCLEHRTCWEEERIVTRLIFTTGGVLLLFWLTACVSQPATSPAQDVLVASDRAENTAVQPAPRLKHYWRWRNNLGWLERHGEILVRNQLGPVDLVFLGDSITHGFEGAGSTVWKRDFLQWNPVNMGFGGDRTEHVLWRIENGALDGIAPKVVVLIIGTNNWRSNTPAEIAQGVLAICDEIHARLPESKVLLLAIFPRGAGKKPDRTAFRLVADTNAILADTDFPDWMTWLDIGSVFLDPEGQVNPALMPDYLHPNDTGYALWSAAMLPELSRLMTER